MINNNRGRFVLHVVALLLIAVLASGCSVAMALYGKRTPNISAIRRDMYRDEVILQLGEPIETMTKDDGGRIDIFEYQVGNDPSAGRAIGHAVLDLLTWGAWEVVGTPVECVQGKTCTLTVEYAEDDKVTKVISGTSKDALGN